MANLSNINNKLIVTDGGNVLVGSTANLSTYTGISLYGANPSLAIKTSSASGWVWTQYVNSSGTNNFSMGVNQSIPYWGIGAGAGMGGANMDLVVASSGNVGVGTYSPDYKLEVESTSDADLVSIKSTAIANNTQMRLGISGNDSVISGTGGSSGNLSFKTYGTQRMYINSSGKVIVGTDSSNALEVFSSGDTEIGFSYASHGNVYAKIIGDITQASPLGGELAFQTATGGSLSERMRITAAGNVIVGDTSGTSPNSADRFLKIGKSNLQDCSIILQDAVETWEIYQNDDLQFSFGTTPTIVMTMQRTTGNVGIGSTSLANISGAVATLTLGSTSATVSGGISFQANSTNEVYTYWENDYLLFQGTVSDCGFKFINNNTNVLMQIDSSGRVGIGAISTAYKLRVKSGSGAGDSGMYLSAGTGNGNHAFYVEAQDGSAEWLAVRGDGEIRLNATSGHAYAAQGIRFGANASANNLDDYEEGSFTPGAYYQNATDQGNTTDNTTIGQYVKIGATVTVWIKLNWTITGSPVNDNVGIKNLPFQGTTTASGASIAVFLKNVSAPILQRIPTSSQTISLWMGTDYNGNYGNEIGAGTHEIATSFTYLTDQ